MANKVLILQGAVDLTDSIIDSGGEGARFSEITSTLVPERDFIVDDSKRVFSPFQDDGLLNPDVNGWRNTEITVFDKNNNLQYSGLITNISDGQTKNTRRLSIKSRDSFGIVLDVPIESLDNTTHINFVLDGDHGAGTRQLLVKNGNTIIPDICILTYTDSLVPNYQITNPQGSPTVNFDLDRDIETDLSDGQALTINVPIEKTGIEEIKDTLNLAYAGIGLTNQLNEPLFDQIQSEDESANRKLIFYIRLENNINLGQHLRNISDMTGYHIRKGSDGRMEPVKQIQWDGTNPQAIITDDEIIYPQKKTYNTDQLAFGYSLPYKANNDQVKKETLSLDPSSPEFKLWLPRVVKRLNTYQDILPVKNPYLYNSKTTAKFYGDKWLDYYGIARDRLTCSIIARFSGGTPISLKLFDVFLLTTDDYVNEPVRVLNYEFDESDGIYNNVIFELINKGFPDLPKP